MGPNNAGKSTILAAFRILAAGMRKASSRLPVPLKGPGGMVLGYEVDLSLISVAAENIFYNYDDSEAATVVFHISNGNSLTLYFPEQGVCYLIPDAQGKSISSTKKISNVFQLPDRVCSYSRASRT